MPRPKSERTDLGKTLGYLGGLQESRFADLVSFGEQVKDAQLQEDAKKDDQLFASVIDLAMNEYGVKQTVLADTIRVSPAAIGRWAKKVNLPAPYSRAGVLQALASIIEEAVARQKADHPLLQRGRA